MHSWIQVYSAVHSTFNIHPMEESRQDPKQLQPAQLHFFFKSPIGDDTEFSVMKNWNIIERWIHCQYKVLQYGWWPLGLLNISFEDGDSVL